MSERIPCRTGGCSRTILAATAERTGGICMPCVHAAAARERAEFIQRNRKDLNEFVGVSDPVEVIKIIHQPRPVDPLVNWIPHPTPVDQLYLELNPQQQARLAGYVEGLLVEDRKQAEKVLLCLAAFTEVPLSGCLRALVENGSFWPSLPFHRASPDIRDHMIARLEWDEENRNHLLIALAWVGDSTVVDLFARWRRQRPSWGKSLFVAPEDYAREAGWELTADGQRRDLYFRSCQKLSKGPSDSPGRFQAITPLERSCPWCQQRLTNLVTVAPTELGAADDGGLLTVTTCEVCSAFGTVFGEYDSAGIGRWSPANSRPAYLPQNSDGWGRLPTDSLQLAGPRSPLFAASQFLPTSVSQLGGHPTWIQDAGYPRCPECSDSMMFIAQVDQEDFGEGSEGIYYAFACRKCRKTAATYQQT